MRNLKRALSLTLASVMLLGMMVVGTSAAGFPDVDDADNVEAIEVLQAVGIMVGDKDTGNFRPDAPVSRAEMAVVMAILQNLTTSYYVSTCPFTDVSGSYDWARGPVGACYATGVISGRSATSFDPGATVTAVEAAAMMLRALGYFKYTEDYAGGFNLSVVTQANKVGLFTGIEGDATSPLTRNQVAKLTLNALQANLVDFTGTPGIEINGVKIGYRAEYTARTSPDTKYAAISSLGTSTSGSATAAINQYYVQLGEERYDGDLKKSGVIDGMGHPSNEWAYKYEPIGTYAREPDRVIVVGKSTKSLDDTIEDLNRNYEWSYGTTPTYSHVYLNGVQQGTGAGINKDISGFMAEDAVNNGVKVGDIVEIYMDSSRTNVISDIVITRYSADRLTADAATRKDGDEVRLPGVIGWTNSDDVKGWEGLQKDDVVYFYRDANGLYTFAKADSFDGSLTAINNKDPNTYVVDGETYTVNGSMTPSEMNMNDPVFNTQYRFWTDNNGYVIYGDELEEALSDYVVIQDIEYVPGEGVMRPGIVQARLVYMDGTTSVEEINSIRSSANRSYAGISTTATSQNQGKPVGSDEHWMVWQDTDVKLHANLRNTAIVNNIFFTYKKNSDGALDLTYVNGTNITMVPGAGGTATTANLTAGKVTAGAINIGVNDNTVFIINEKANATQNDYKFNAYTGKNNTPDLTGAQIHYVRKGGVVTHMYINTYTTKSFSGDYVFFLKSTPERYRDVKREDGTTYGYNEYKAIVNGEYELVKVRADKVSGNNLSTNGNVSLEGGSAAIAVGLFDPTYDSDGRITSLTASANMDVLAYGYMMDGTSLYTDKNGGTGTQAGMHYANTYYFDDDAPVFVMDEDGDVTDNGYINQLGEDSNDRIYVVKADAAGYEAKFAVVIEEDAPEYGLEVVKTGGTGSFTLTYAGTANNDGTTDAKAYYWRMAVTGTVNLQFVADDAVKIECVKDAGDWGQLAAGNAIANVGSGNNHLLIRITESDGTQVYYAFHGVD